MAILDEDRPRMEDIEVFQSDAYEGPDTDFSPNGFVAPTPSGTTTTPAAGYKAPDVYAPGKKATVSGQLQGFLESGSPYVRAARQRGREEAASRGLLNSSIAAGAAERSAIETALPVAVADAKAFQEAGMAGFLGEIEGAKKTQAISGEQALVGTQEGASSRLSTQKTAETAALDAYRGGIQSELSAQQAKEQAYQTAYEANIASNMSK